MGYLVPYRLQRSSKTRIRRESRLHGIQGVTASEMYYEEIRKQVLPEAELDPKSFFIRKPIANEDFVQQVQDILKS